MSYKSPFANPTSVKRITEGLKTLSTSSVNIEEDVFRVKAQTDDLVGKYHSSFDIVSKIPAFFDQFVDTIRQDNNTARDVAIKIRAQFDDYVLLLEAIETITKKEEAKDVADAFIDDIKIQNPLKETPLEGYQDVTYAFNDLWKLKNEESKHLADILSKATDSKKVVAELAAEIKLVVSGIKTVQGALRDYASHICN